jgi:glycosyltransferase involved in cell wall biosynthesis
LKYRDKNLQLYKDILPKTNDQNKKIKSLEEIFNSRRLFIPDTHLTPEYIRYLRKINETEEEIYKKKYSENETKIDPSIFNKRVDQLNFKDYLSINVKNKLLFNTSELEINDKPLISIIISAYNRGKSLLISVRSVQNQHFKNIEIIIVDDCSTDDSSVYLKDLLETDPRIRVFTHLKNMGLWRTRLTGALYSRGKYIIYFDAGDLYEDNYVLEDAYNIMEKYNLDSCKFLFRLLFNYERPDSNRLVFHVYNNSKIVYETPNIKRMNRLVFRGWGNIWTRITRKNIIIKGLYLLNERVLNIYKNFWEDVWHNELISRVSYSFLIVERIGYLYCRNHKGYGKARFGNDKERNNMIQEYLNFLVFDYFLMPNSTSGIISTLKRYNSPISTIKLSYLKSKFYILDDLLTLLINDTNVSLKDKIFLNNLLQDSKMRQKNITNTF